MKLTKTAVEKLKPPAAGQAFFRDDELRGFALRITAAGTKSYVVEKLVGRKVRRITIGRANVLSAEVARKRAQEMLGKIAGGRDPVEEKAIAEARSVTLLQGLEAYLEARKELKPTTAAQYRKVIEGKEKKNDTPLALADWKNRALVDITPDMVERRHKKLGDERGEAWANLAMRVLRALFSFAEAKYEDAKGRPIITVNPVRKLSRVRAWYPNERRNTYIKINDLAAWFGGVQSLSGNTGHDYLLTVLMTGLRREEAATLLWSDINLKTKTLTVRETKNGDPLTLPISTQLAELLTKRKVTAKNQWVFPGQKKKAHLTEPKMFTEAVAVTCGIKTSIHDLRRTFATIAEGLDISTLTLKRLLNHRSGENDVTTGYVILDVERLRKPVQMINDLMWKAMTAKGKNVVDYPGAHNVAE